MAATTMEAKKAPESVSATPQHSATTPPQREGAFDWEEREQPGDAVAFKLWVIGYLTMALLALSDGLRALLGW